MSFHFCMDTRLAFPGLPERWHSQAYPRYKDDVSTTEEDELIPPLPFPPLKEQADELATEKLFTGFCVWKRLWVTVVLFS